MQHAGLRDTCQADTLVVEVFVRALRWAFPDFNYQWLIDEVKESLPQVSAEGSDPAGERCRQSLDVGHSCGEVLETQGVASEACESACISGAVV